MLTLLTFPGDDRQPSFSPFCVKAMCLLEMSGREWEPTYLAEPSKMPYGRLPVLKTDSELIPDSGNIQAWLVARGADFDAGLSAGERAWSAALVRMVEEGLRYGLVHDRWLRDDCWEAVRGRFFEAVPAAVRPIIAGTVRRRVRKTLKLQGTAQFSEADRLARLGRELQAVRDTLGEKDYLFGSAPGSSDAAIVPVLDMIRDLPCKTGLRDMVRGDARLMAWLDRARASMYPR